MANIDTNDNQAEIRALADEIAAYLREREQVADTLEGIARWWIMRQRLQEGERKVSQAMDYLCARGLVEMRKLPDGRVLYTSSTQTDARDAGDDDKSQDERGN
ncbi:MAG: hypothetical protein K0Q67_2379 [Cellvibrio sp.]|jgi:hypothetical protein|nr:hypothetical protein [Cellvibrio sp.]MDF3013809.1 hypothetical protein [Cellvibrio sp.]